MFFVTSSQGNDRCGSNADASYFANLGYTVFNYDKRGTGKSEGNWQSATIEELCSDDIAAIRFFAEFKDLSFSEIGIKGSSQGGIKTPYILTEIPELKFGISVSCPSGTLFKSDLNNWKNAITDQIGKENIEMAYKVQKAGYDYLANNLSYKKIKIQKKKYEILTMENTTHSMTILDEKFPYFQILSPEYLVSIVHWLHIIENN